MPPGDQPIPPPPPFGSGPRSFDAPPGGFETPPPTAPGLPYPPQQYPQTAPGQQYPPQQYPQFPGQAPGGYQAYGMPFVIAQRNSGMAVASMVLGIVGIVLFCLFAIPCLLATIFGGIALGQINKGNGSIGGRGMAIAGLVLGIIGIVLFLIVLAAGNHHWYFSRN